MTNQIHRRLLSLCFSLLLTAGLLATSLAQAAPQGTIVLDSPLSYAQLVKSLDSAVKAKKMGLVTRASATKGVKAVLKEDIPGNMVVGVYRPDFAKRMLAASVPAGIEAPLRFYLTEQADGSSQLTYKQPSAVFAPYDDPSGQLSQMAQELDSLFAKIAAEAVK